MPLYPSSLSSAGWTLAKKTINETRVSTTTLTADTALQFAMIAGRTYIIRGKIHFDTVAAADFKWSVTIPGSFFVMYVRRACIVPGATAFSSIAVDTGIATVAITGTGSAGGFVDIAGTILADPSTSGIFSFDWAQNNSNAGDTTVLEGSYIEYAEHPSSA